MPRALVAPAGRGCGSGSRFLHRYSRRTARSSASSESTATEMASSTCPGSWTSTPKGACMWPTGRTPGSTEKIFKRPVTVRVDDEGRIIVLEAVANRLQVYVKGQDWIDPRSTSRLGRQRRSLASGGWYFDRAMSTTWGSHTVGTNGKT